MSYNYNICYVIKSEVNIKMDQYSFLHFSKERLRLRPILQLIAQLPISIPELFVSKEEKINLRLTSIFPGYYIKIIEDFNEISVIKHYFKIVFVDIDDVVDENHNDVLYISFNRGRKDNIPYFEDITIDNLKRFFLENIKDSYDCYSDLEDNYQEKGIDTDFHIPVNIFTYSNILLAQNLGVKFKDVNVNVDVNVVEQSINIINLIKSKIANNLPRKVHIPSADYLITDFSIPLEYSANSKQYKKHFLKKINEENYEQIASAVTFAKNSKNIDHLNIIDGNNEYILRYKEEVYFNSLMCFFYTASRLTPEIKLKLTNNNIFPTLSEISYSIRKSVTKKLQSQIRKFSNIVTESADTNFDYFSNSLNKQIKIISNFPLEWTNIDGLPLMIRHNVSRIFNTPSLIKENLLLRSSSVDLTLESFAKILVISSFKDNDPISFDLINELKKIISSDIEVDKIHVDAFLTDFKPEIIYKNVRTKDELVNSLNAFEHALVIFDMHGGHKENDSCGVLGLSSEMLNPYDLIDLARIPPIVILSSCDTSPADRGHYNVANAFLCAGAKTVLASTYPILSADAARFIGRLYTRLRYYLPERILKNKQSLRWSEFMTGLNRRVYFNYFILHLFENFKIKNKYPDDYRSKYERLINIINSILENRPENYFSGILYFIEDILDLSKDLVLTELHTNFLFSENLNYVQIGFPEDILICAEDLTQYT
ncbi:CHAT domain-containing protein [Ignatzschineria rhizosphaerae]|uniref:CHAT domain-containing protein n=1 Tax=Ignatzschineria rhizosphaerae TaxID=2923279 RepID=A0ABY3X2K5_9GAMM|nr:CHAT domain-containing protein [Ignatzschineria rhizosphaerae]UNM97123.1 CHAT domain-containing protein [Ignatzschineria rhizosphaerae]